MRLQNTPQGQQLLPETFSDLTTAFHAVASYRPDHQLIKADVYVEERRLTLPEIILSGDDETGDILHCSLTVEESAVILSALKRKARERTPSWDQANAKDVLQSMGIDTRRLHAPHMQWPRLGRFAVSGMQRRTGLLARN